ncbi:MAG: hypothetical protein HFJ57_02635 [Clostridia bacterium]|nr:hypothetical protein [Clostridia bacterium]
MATNPMQRKARNSILIGVVIGLLIGAVVVGLLFLQLTNVQKNLKEIKDATRQVYVVKNDVKSGTTIDSTMIELKSATKDVIPSDYISTIPENSVAKINITKGTVLSKALIDEADEKTTNDLREQQYNMIILPQYLEVDDYIDIRLTLPNGQDYIVVSKKRIKNITEDTIWVNMYEEETLAMTNAIVEAYVMKGSKLYATTYVDAGMQQNAIPTYVPSSYVINLINADKNITEEARRTLVERYTQELRLRRESDITSQVNAYGEEAKDNIEAGIEEEITKSKEARKQYIDSLGVSE